MSQRDEYTIEEKLWMMWFGASAGTFIALEGHAIATRNRKATLTYATRHVLGLDPPKPWKYAGIVFITATSLWVAAHLVTGRFVPSILHTAEELIEELNE